MRKAFQKSSEKTEKRAPAHDRAMSTMQKSETPGAPSSFFQLQRAVGNRAVGRLIQAKLEVSQPGDIYEQEADRVADEVMRMPEPHLSHTATVSSLARRAITQRACAECEENLQRQEMNEEEEERIQAKNSSGQTSEAAPDIDARIQGLRGNGQPLPASASSFFEQRFGYDFSGVRVHTGAQADELARGISARAFTTGHDIVFGLDEITCDLLPISVTVSAGVAKLCANFNEFKKFFGDFAGDVKHSYLAHAVYGFFNNGGSRCYVMRVTQESDIPKFLVNFEAIDEIAIVAAPGLAGTDAAGKNTRGELIIHCKIKTQDRFAIFDSPETVETTGNLDLTLLDPKNTSNVLPPTTDFAAFYFPWLQVFDPVKGPIFVPPSGHLAGVYARVDTQRGVHKAPANEAVLGVLGLKYRLSKAQQDGLNPQGVNCIRDLNGNLYVWGGRTIGGDANADLKYISVRRTLLFLRESIDEGLQWAVFEPNDPALWQKITRNVTAFLTNVWRSGALFGTTPQQAFFVKCDAETNPPDVRDAGQVITEIGVAIVRPAEFIIFRISQFTAPGS